MDIKRRISSFVTFVALMMANAAFVCAQPVADIISMARDRSVQAIQARSSFVSDYWAWRAYQASRLPSLSLYGELGNFNRFLNLLQDPGTGSMVYTTSYNMQNTIGLMASQNITFTGGTVSLYSDLSRIDQFGTNAGKTWYAQPVALAYTQPIFSYNQFKWDKLISPKEYEKAKRAYLEAMEEISLQTVQYYYDLLLAQRTYEYAVANYGNTSRMLEIARERLSIGSVTRDEYLQLELRQLNDSLAINDNMVALKKARMQLNSLLGLDETQIIEPCLDNNLPEVIMDYDFVLSKCNTNSSFNLANSIDILNSEAAVAKAKADRGITMQLVARFGLTNTANELAATYGNLLDQEVVGLSFNIPIFDWGMGKGKVKKAEAAAEVVRARVLQAENDKRVSLFTAVGQFNNQRQQCYVSGRAAAIAEERFGLIMDNFLSGKATVIDLNTARSENDSAQQKYIQDISSFWIYYYTLRKLTLYDFIEGEDISVSYDEMVN